MRKKKKKKIYHLIFHPVPPYNHNFLSSYFSIPQPMETLMIFLSSWASNFKVKDKYKHYVEKSNFKVEDKHKHKHKHEHKHYMISRTLR